MRNGDERNTFEAEQEILAILSQMNIMPVQEEPEAAEETPVDTDDTNAIPAAPDTTPTDIPLILEPDLDDKKAMVDKRADKKVKKAAEHAVEQAAALVTKSTENAVAETSPFSKIGAGIRDLFPKKGDPASEIVRKIIFIISLVAFLVSLGFLTYYMVLEPNEVNRKNDSYVALYNDTRGNANIETDGETKNIQPSFRQLYAINKDIKGWLSFNSTDSDHFMNINLPVVWCGNNETYLSRSFDGQYSRSGTLFFEQTNSFENGASNKVTIVYGHNMASGTMFAPLNKLIGNVYRARSAATLKLDTLRDSNQYKVIAVIVSDESAAPAYRFGYLRTTFADDTDFMNYVNDLRARSLFDYPVDVQPNDELVILSTCTNKSQVKVENGRFAVIARRVREGENATVDTAKIVKNDDVIMPYAWYTAQSLEPHAFYTQTDYVIPGTAINNGTTTETRSTTTTINTGETTKNTSSDTTTQTTNTTTVETTETTTAHTTTDVTTSGTADTETTTTEDTTTSTT